MRCRRGCSGVHPLRHTNNVCRKITRGNPRSCPFKDKSGTGQAALRRQKAKPGFTVGNQGTRGKSSRLLLGS